MVAQQGADSKAPLTTFMLRVRVFPLVPRCRASSGQAYAGLQSIMVKELAGSAGYPNVLIKKNVDTQVKSSTAKLPMRSTYIRTERGITAENSIMGKLIRKEPNNLMKNLGTDYVS